MLLRVCTELIPKEQTCWVKAHMHRKDTCTANTGTYCHTALQGTVPMDTPISNAQEAHFCKYFYGFYSTSKPLVHLEYVSRIYENRPQLTLKSEETQIWGAWGAQWLKRLTQSQLRSWNPALRQALCLPESA